MSDILTYCRPEDVGVRPEWVEDYINTVNRAGKAQHSFLMMRGTSVFAEGYFKPFHKDWFHRMYSVSKSFTSAAVGMLIDDGKISLDDLIIKYFPEQDDGNVHPYIREMTIRNMLMMSTCHVGQAYGPNDPDWIKAFFHPSLEPDHPAGTEFRYDTSATHTLCALVERLTGKTFLEFLKDRALREIGFSEDAWCVESPEGTAWGGSGVECTTRDLARFALLFAHEGKVGEKQYISKEYAKAATANQWKYASIGPDYSSPGYGYQIWCTRNDSFAFLGMGGQLAVFVPDKDLMFVCTSDTQGDANGYHCFIDWFFESVVNKVTEEKLNCEDKAYEHLKAVLSGLELNAPFGEVTSPMAEQVCGSYRLYENPMGMTEFKLEINGTAGMLTYETSRGTKYFPFCLGRYADTVFPENHYSGKRINTPSEHPYRCLNCGVWESENTFLVRTYIIDDYFGNMAARFTFDGDSVILKLTKTAEWFLDEYVGEAKGKRFENL